MKYLFSILLLALALSTTQAQIRPIFTDRSSQTDAVDIMPAGRVQFEVGYFFFTEDAGSIETSGSSIPNLKIKYGISEKFEVNIITNYQTLKVEIPGSTNKFNGLSPLSIGGKLMIKDGDGPNPKMSATGNVIFPTLGSEDFENDDLNAIFRLIMENDLGSGWAMTYSVGVDILDNDNPFAGTIMFGKGFSDQISAWAEVFASFINDAGDPYGVDFGIAYLVSDDLSVDASFALPLNDNAIDFFFNLGFGWKLDTR